jgi:hypothetical protein
MDSFEDWIRRHDAVDDVLPQSVESSSLEQGILGDLDLLPIHCSRTI